MSLSFESETKQTLATPAKARKQLDDLGSRILGAEDSAGNSCFLYGSLEEREIIRVVFD